jgi:penicillin-binding protein 1A
MNPALNRIVTQVRATALRLWQWASAHPWRAVALLPALAVLYVLVLIPFTPGISDLRKAKVGQPSVLLARRTVPCWPNTGNSTANGSSWTGSRQRGQRTDRHRGPPLLPAPRHRSARTAGRLARTLQGDLQGGSTITQQLARNLYPDEIGRAASITRKLKEAITALKIEAVYSKTEILETYLNTVPFLYNAFGIEMAARTYFDKSAQRAGRAGERHADRHAQGHELLQPGAEPRTRACSAATWCWPRW